MTLTQFSQYLVQLTIIVLASGCVLPTQAPLHRVPATSTSTTLTITTPTPSQTAEAQLVRGIDEYMIDLIEQDQFSGSLLVARDGKVLISKGYGMANIDLEIPNTPQTKFRLGSITKQFTAMAILQLQQQGKLNVQNPICLYIQDCPEAWQPITLHHLLTHTSGLYNYTASSHYTEFKKQFATPINIIDLFRDLPLEFGPGNRWKYSNSGYIVLGYIIETVSGQPYASFLQDNIFNPLQMVNTGYADNRRLITPHAVGYSEPAIEADDIDMSVPYAAGGLYSTVEDVFLWDQALHANKLISIALQNEMLTPFISIPIDRMQVSNVSYGYGWRIGVRFDRRWVAHGGGIDGFATIFDRYPEDKVAIIVLSNLESARVGDIAMEIAQMIFVTK